jgi:Uma2 family endonuclease
LKKAELIQGVVYVPAAVQFEQHGGPHFDLITWLGLYRMNTPGVRGGDNTSLRLDLANEPQPDAFLIIMPDYGGQARIDKDGFITGAPELVAEVAASSASYDLHDKLDAYREQGVQEYVVWRVLDETINWYVLQEGRYDLLPGIPSGLLQSQVFPGLWLEPAALIRGDMLTVGKIVGQGTASPEHASFVAALARRKAQSPSPPPG